jgi:hypothetical protein
LAMAQRARPPHAMAAATTRRWSCNPDSA